MGKAKVTRRIESPAKLVWESLSWFGMEVLAGGSLFSRVDFHESQLRPGITKTLHVNDGLPLCERLEWINESDMTYGYRVVDTGSLPVTDYQGRVRVTPAGPDACNVIISSTFSGVGISDTEWSEMWIEIEQSLLTAVECHIAGSEVA
tara:strand:- start:5038 stop:5481 length:444 start_codon:yes stop_codon:yes gene_type:complete